MSIELSLTALDCPDPIALANFYASLLELEVEPLNDFPLEDVTWLEVQKDGVTVLGFQKVDNYVAPTWPEGPVPQQLHLDFHSTDLDKDEAHALAVGARKTDFQPGETFRVFLDPVGHPFCLVLRQELREG
ncbi:MAG: VOC family protein [Acidimicrobiales bacterium]